MMASATIPGAGRTVGTGLACLELLLLLVGQGGCVKKRCYEDADCAAPKICGVDGKCAYECSAAGDCAEGFVCEKHRCMPHSSGPITCPGDMVAVAETFCIDRYEASRPDADAADAGGDDSRAQSVAGVLPWQVANNPAAATACRASGKRLCQPEEWLLACTGPDQTVYAYGDAYEPETCNGIDTFGRADFHLMPTGSFPGCTNEWGAFDLNGNLWEHLAGGNDNLVRGGAYNCGDSAALHRCAYVPRTWTPSARGFRCCLTPDPDSGEDGGNESEPDDGSWPEDPSETEFGCLEAGDDDSFDEFAVEGSDEIFLEPSGEAGSELNETTVESEAQAESADDGGATCPPEMSQVGQFCIDVYEASRKDATAMSAGTSMLASTRSGVIPWYPVTLAQARAGCASMDKRLCLPEEWVAACGGLEQSAYAYGDEYDPVVCNGIDTYCRCSVAACADLAVCPYPHCYNQASLAEDGGPCGATFHVMPTGSFSGCVSPEGLYDVNGNVWEVVDTSDGLEHFRGGAYNCGNSELLHRCDYDATWSPSAKGFRCCRDLLP